MACEQQCSALVFSARCSLLPEESLGIVISYLNGLRSSLVALRASSHALKDLSTGALATTLTLALQRREAVPELGLKALSRMCTENDKDAASVALSHLKHQNVHVRRLAIAVAARTVPQGDKEAFRSLCLCLQDVDESVRRAAVQLLPRLAKPAGDREATEIMLCQLDHWSSSIRLSNALVLVAIADVGDTSVIDVLVRCLRMDSSEVVRRIAAKGLARIAGRGNYKAEVALAAARNDNDALVRVAAQAALVHVVPRPRAVIAYATKEQRRSASNRGGFAAHSVSENPRVPSLPLKKGSPAKRQRIENKVR